MPAFELCLWDAAGSRRLEGDDGLPVIDLDAAVSADGVTPVMGAIEARLDWEIALLRIVHSGLVEAECLRGRPLPPAGFRWRERSRVPPGDDRPSWQRAHWLGELCIVLDHTLAGLGSRRTGPLVQTRHTATTAMIQVPTDHGPVWLKAVLPIFAHEPRVVRWLGGVCPGRVPTVLAAGRDWWISAPFPEPASSPATPGECGGHVLATLAEVQVSAAGSVAELRALGCPDRPLRRLVADLDRVAGRDDLLTRAERVTLGTALPRFARLCRSVSDAGLPASLVHGDLHAGNVLRTAAGWFLFDWTDACVAHPAVDLALAVLAEDDAGTAAGYRAFQQVWAAQMPDADLAVVLAAAPIIGAAHQAVSYEWISDATDHSAEAAEARAELTGWLRFWVRRLAELL